MKKIDFESLKTLVVAPGTMSYRFINGREVSLLTVATIFFIANLTFFAEPARSDLYTQMNNMPYSGIVKEMVQRKIKKNKTNQKKFEAVYEKRSWIISRALLVLTVLYFSVALFFINYRKTLNYIDHLVVSFEFMTLATLYLRDHGMDIRIDTQSCCCSASAICFRKKCLQTTAIQSDD